MRPRSTPIAAFCLLALSSGCDKAEEPNPSYTGPLRVVLTPHDAAKKPPWAPSQPTTFAFKTSGTTAELTFGECHATFEQPKAKSDRFHWVLKSGGPCPTPAGPATIKKGTFTLYPNDGILITLNGATADDSFDVEWSTIIAGKN